METRICVVPAFTAVIFPLASTVAISGSRLLNSSFLRPLPLNFLLFPFPEVLRSRATADILFLGVLTFTLHSKALPLTVADITALPAEYASTSTDFSERLTILTTFGSDDAHSTGIEPAAFIDIVRPVSPTPISSFFSARTGSYMVTEHSLSTRPPSRTVALPAPLALILPFFTVATFFESLPFKLLPPASVAELTVYDIWPGRKIFFPLPIVIFFASLSTLAFDFPLISTVTVWDTTEFFIVKLPVPSVLPAVSFPLASMENSP